MYRVQIPVGAMLEAARFLARDWGEDRSISYTGHSFAAGESPERTRYFVFECGASDGTRWFIAADRHGPSRHHADDIAALEALILADS
jgi:hypothetical protein